MCDCVCAHMKAMLHLCGLEDNLYKLVLAFYYVGPGIQTQVVRWQQALLPAETSPRPTSRSSSQFMGKRGSFKKKVFFKMLNVMKTQTPHFKVLLWDMATVRLRREWSPVCCKRGKFNTVT